MYAEVIVDLLNSETDKVFDYIIPDNLNIKEGTRVLVPFGNRKIEGYVIKIKNQTELSLNKLKPIIKVLDDFVAIIPEMLTLKDYMVEKYNLRLADTLRLFIPSEMRGSKVRPIIKTYCELNLGNNLENIINKLPKNAKRQIELLSFLTKSGKTEISILNNKFGSNNVKKFISLKYILETKEEVVVEIESISYQTKEVQEVNMKRGERKVTTAGVEGSKEVTYKVAYDNSHREIKREKLSEKITKNSVDEVVMVGISDYNINTSTYVEYAGPLCKTLNSIGNMCDETEMNFKAISVDSNPIITCIAETCLTNQVNEHISATWKPNSVLLEATYQGETRYFFTNKATDTQKLTLEDCEKYGLACGSW